MFIPLFLFLEGNLWEVSKHLILDQNGSLLDTLTHLHQGRAVPLSVNSAAGMDRSYRHNPCCLPTLKTMSSWTPSLLYLPLYFFIGKLLRKLSLLAVSNSCQPPPQEIHTHTHMHTYACMCTHIYSLAFILIILPHQLLSRAAVNLQVVRSSDQWPSLHLSWSFWSISLCWPLSS